MFAVLLTNSFRSNPECNATKVVVWDSKSHIWPCFQDSKASRTASCSAAILMQPPPPTDEAIFCKLSLLLARLNGLNLIMDQNTWK